MKACVKDYPIAALSRWVTTPLMQCDGVYKAHILETTEVFKDGLHHLLSYSTMGYLLNLSEPQDIQLVEIAKDTHVFVREL